jgi:hypothetical protein
MASPEDLRIGDRERDEVTGLLHDAFAQGRITREELDERLDATLSARTTGDLRRVTADLPGPEGTGSWPGPYDAPSGRPGPWAAAEAAGGLPWNGGRLHDGLPYEGKDGDLATWGWHAAAARRRAVRRRLRAGRPPVGFLVLAVLMVAMVASHAAWPLFFAGRLLFFVCLGAAVFGVARHRRRHGHGYGHGPVPWRGSYRERRRHR